MGRSCAEQRRVALVAPSPPEAGLSRAPPGQPERSARGVDHEPGIVIPEKNCTWCVARQMLCLWKLARRARSCQLCWQLKNPCRRFEEMVAEGKWRAEGERGSRKRPRVVVEETEVWAEETERSQKEDSGPPAGGRSCQSDLATQQTPLLSCRGVESPSFCLGS